MQPLSDMIFRAFAMRVIFLPPLFDAAAAFMLMLSAALFALSASRFFFRLRHLMLPLFPPCR